VTRALRRYTSARGLHHLLQPMALLLRPRHRRLQPPRRPQGAYFTECRWDCSTLCVAALRRLPLARRPPVPLLSLSSQQLSQRDSLWARIASAQGHPLSERTFLTAFFFLHSGPGSAVSPIAEGPLFEVPSCWVVHEYPSIMALQQGRHRPRPIVLQVPIAQGCFPIALGGSLFYTAVVAHSHGRFCAVLRNYIVLPLLYSSHALLQHHSCHRAAATAAKSPRPG